MFTTKLQESIDNKWKNCWPVSDLRPLALLDLISYLFFIKKSDDLALIHQNVKTSGIDNFIYTKEIEDFTWSSLQNLSDREIHQLFIKENGVFGLMNNYAKLDSIYSDYFKSPLLIEPTPKLIFNAIEIINLIETNDKATRVKIVEYLFEKLNSSSKSSQAFIPAPILNLMVAIADPISDDNIFDPAAGNGSLLISAFKHIHSNNHSVLPSPANQLSEFKISGVESDVVHLRVAAMNMMLHGINDPGIYVTPHGKTVKEKYSLIISSLLSAEEITTSENASAVFTERESSLLNDITERLSSSGRAVVLVRQDLLQNGSSSILQLRKKLVDQYNLEGVITLDTKKDTLFSGAAILIFDKSKSTDNIWFYKWRTANKKTNKSSSDDENRNYDMTEAAHIMEQWKIRKDLPVPSSAYCFYIPVDNVRSNNYNLSFNDYKLKRLLEPAGLEAGKDIPGKMETILAANKESLHEFFESGTPLPIEKQKRKVASILVIVFILIGVALAFIWTYSRQDGKNFMGKSSSPAGNRLDNNSKISGSKISNIPSASNDLVSFMDQSKGGNNSESKPGSKKYTVINKAWFHSEPDSAKIKPLYIMPRKELVLTSQEEENGFVYVVYINANGETTHGWLDKKDLQPLD
ncbi:MAG: N-6 DNA methylase [Ginsengibacter sp.]